jgi:hypothetical protein
MKSLISADLSRPPDGDAAGGGELSGAGGGPAPPILREHLHRLLCACRVRHVDVARVGPATPEAEFMNVQFFSLRFLGIILRVLGLEVSVWISHFLRCRIY